MIVFVSETVVAEGGSVRREWEPEELIAAWTLLDGDWELIWSNANLYGTIDIDIDMGRRLDLGLAA